MFRTATQNRVYQNVVEQIQEAILTGKLRAGDMLPPERELKEMFKTSRGTLREALRVLEQKGLIEIRLGTNGGAFVKDPTTERITESLDLLIRLQRISLNQLAEFREGVESCVVALAAERATTPDIRQLETLLKEARRAVDKGAGYWEDFVGVDQQIHLALAQITGNPIYIFVLKSVHENIHRYYEQYLPKEQSVLEENYRDLCRIVSAVAQGNKEEACLLAREHVSRFNRIMKVAENLN